MTALNRALRWAFDLLHRPFEGMSAWVGLTVVSLLSAVVALLVFKRVSNQDGIDRIKRKMQASLFEIRLFNNDLRAIFKAQWAFLIANFKYLGLMLVPLLWLLIPFVLAYVHLDGRYRYEGPEVGQDFVLNVRLAGEDETGAGDKPAIDLETPSGVEATSPSVWSALDRTMSWRLRADEPGLHRLTVRHAGHELVKEVAPGPKALARSPDRPAAGFLAQIDRPLEPPLPADSGVEEITVRYEERSWGELSLAALQIPLAWWFWWLVLMVVLGYALSRPLGVKI